MTALKTFIVVSGGGKVSHIFTWFKFRLSAVIKSLKKSAQSSHLGEDRAEASRWIYENVRKKSEVILDHGHFKH